MECRFLDSLLQKLHKLCTRSRSSSVRATCSTPMPTHARAEKANVPPLSLPLYWSVKSPLFKPEGDGNAKAGPGPLTRAKGKRRALAKPATCVYRDRLSSLPIHFFPNPQPSHCTSADLLYL